MVRAVLELVGILTVLMVALACATLCGQEANGFPTTGAPEFRQTFSPTLPVAGDGTQAGAASFPTFDQAGATGTAFGGPTDPVDGTQFDEEPEPFDLADTVAQVGDQYILKGELIGDANLVFRSEFAKIAKLSPEEQDRARSMLMAQRDQLAEQLLDLAIDRKLMYLEFIRSLPPVPDEKKAQERQKELQKKVAHYFRNQLNEMAIKVRNAQPDQYQTFIKEHYQLFRVALVMKNEEIESVDDPRLQRVLRECGTSLQTQQREFAERELGRQAVGSKLKLQPEITPDQMLAYYREHIDEFEVPTRARWEQLTVLFSRFGTKEEAGEAIANMGNQVYLGGAPFTAVAQKFSQEKNASRGGYHDWTPMGDFRLSRELNEAIFSLPINKLSHIIEDAEGLHIVRVIERVEAHVTPFTEAQADIKKKLKTEMRNKDYAEHLAKLKERAPIWTARDNPIADRRTGNQRPGVNLPR